MVTTKEKLIESAKELIAEKGFEKTKVEEITKKAEVAKGSFYTYFKTKEDIFGEIFKNTFQAADEKMSQLNFGKNLKENLNLFIESMLKGAWSDKKTFKIITNIFTNPELIKVIMSMGYNFKDSLKKHVKRMMEESKEELNEDVLKNLDFLYSPLEKFIKIYVGELMGMTENFVLGTGLSEEDIKNHTKFLVDFLYRALKK